MITKAFKCLNAMFFATSGSNLAKSCIKVKSPNGSDFYIGPYFQSIFPSNAIFQVMMSGANAGIWVGAGNKAESDSDYSLESRITSGLTANTPTATPGYDSDYNPTMTIDFTLTNTSASEIVVREIGYFQQAHGSTTLGSAATSTNIIMLDRTVLSNPIAIPAGEYAAVRYTLKSIVPASIRP